MPFDAFLSVWCVRGSQGLQAGWLSDGEKNTGKATEQRRGLI